MSEDEDRGTADPLDAFHPAVRRWFEGRFPQGPSEPQIAGWPAIRRREDTLIAAPTGTGKTLAAFLVCISAPMHLFTPARLTHMDRKQPKGCTVT